jgi:inner membrane protein
MEIFVTHPGTTWFVIGFLFFVLEFFAPGFILFFFGAGAWITALLCLFIPMSVSVQLAIYCISTGVSLVLFRKNLTRIMHGNKPAAELDSLVGSTATALTEITPSKNGSVEYHGTSWQARSDFAIRQGEKVLITGNESILLVVKPIQS